MEILIERLNSDDESERCFAAQDLGREGCAQHLEPLLARLQIENSRIVKEALVVALGELKNLQDFGPLIGLLGSDEAFLRNSAVTILKKIGARAIPSLLESLNQADPDIRKFALDTLNIIEAELNQKIYNKALRDPDVNIRITAVEYVGHHRLHQFKPLVEQVFLDSPRTLLTRACLETLAEIGDTNSWEVVAQRFPEIEDVPVLLRDPWLRMAERRPCLQGGGK